MHFINEARKHHETLRHNCELAEERTAQFLEMPIREQDALKVAWSLKQSLDSGLRAEENEALRRGTLRRGTLQKSQPDITMRKSGSTYRGTRYADPLFQALTQLGLSGRGEAEQKEIKILCEHVELDSLSGEVDFNSFVFDLVPQARARLMELHREQLTRDFDYYDQDGSGCLDYYECVAMCQKISRNLDTAGHAEVLEEFESLFEELKQPDEHCGDHLDVEGFQVLFERVREKSVYVRQLRVQNIIDAGDVTEEQAKTYAEELLMLHETFRKCDNDGNGRLDSAEIFLALLEHGLVPLDTSERARVTDIMEEAFQASGSDCLSFSEFLNLIFQIRDSTKRVDETRLRKYFADCDKEGDGLLTFAQAATMFDKLGLLPYCQQDQEEMKNVILAVDEDDSGTLDFGEFEALVQNITEMLRANMRRRENAAGVEIGFTTQQMVEFREIFFYLDTKGNGELDIVECRKMLTLLRIDMCSEALQEHFESADRSRNGRIDLEGFLHFVHAISITANVQELLPQGEPQLPAEAEEPKLDDRLKHFQIGQFAGLGQQPPPVPSGDVDDQASAKPRARFSQVVDS